MFSHVWFFVILWSVAHQVPLSMGFSRQESSSGLPFPNPGDLTDSGIEVASPALAGGSFTTAPPLLTKTFFLQTSSQWKKKKIKLQSWMTGLWGCERRSLFWRTFGKARAQGEWNPLLSPGSERIQPQGTKWYQLANRHKWKIRVLWTTLANFWKFESISKSKLKEQLSSESDQVSWGPRQGLHGLSRALLPGLFCLLILPSWGRRTCPQRHRSWTGRGTSGFTPSHKGEWGLLSQNSSFTFGDPAPSQKI